MKGIFRLPFSRFLRQRPLRNRTISETRREKMSPPQRKETIYEKKKKNLTPVWSGWCQPFAERIEGLPNSRRSRRGLLVLIPNILTRIKGDFTLPPFYPFFPPAEPQ
ncbi:hypothetical protein TWF506_002199 [Arthrobotrys conoides]|uniref:Uncharacterized protein n=1 Tax=Arthrobotrys conoides TaxID=74498 RepID=A0AAN8RUL7_9PEZI